MRIINFNKLIKKKIIIKKKITKYIYKKKLKKCKNPSSNFIHQKIPSQEILLYQNSIHLILESYPNKISQN